MKDLECSVQGTVLVEKDVPVFYGMPTPDSDIFEIGDRFPRTVHEHSAMVADRYP